MRIFNCGPKNVSEVTFLGIGCDFGSSGKRGCHNAPDIIRQLSQLSGKSEKIMDIGTGELLFRTDKISDGGILKYDSSKSADSFLTGVQMVAEQIFKESILFSLGGDHLVSYPLIKAAFKSFGKLQVLHFDGHFDSNSIGENSVPSHNNFVTYLCEDPGLERWVTLGQRGMIRGEGSRHPNVISTKHALVFKQLDKRVPIYVTIDMDAMDLCEFRAVSFPEPGVGLRMSQILETLRLLKTSGFQIKGIDICEYNPSLDTETFLDGRQLVRFIGQILSILQNGKTDE